jgi:hypothetical protein
MAQRRFEGLAFEGLTTYDVYAPLLVAYAQERGWELTAQEAAALRRLGHATVLTPLGRWTKAEFRALVTEVTGLIGRLEVAEQAVD